MFRRILLASASAMALSGAAFAADLPVTTPPPVYLPPPPMWTGFYIGVNAGGTWSNSNNINTASSNVFAFAGGGGPNLAAAITTLSNFNAPLQNGAFIGGGQIGYNYQFGANWVAGIEADIDGVAGSNGSRSFSSAVGVPAFPTNTVIQDATESKRLDYLGTVRGRLGFLITPTLLAYGTGGLAYGGVNGQTTITQLLTGPNAVFPNPWFTTGSFNSTRVGWTAGGGAEWMFLPNWSLKVEYLYYNLASVTWNDGLLLTNAAANSPFTINAVRSSTRFNGNIVRAGINYHFNWTPAPIVAKY